VSHEQTRKSFLAKALGLAVVAFSLPRTLVKAAPVAPVSTSGSAATVTPVPQTRTVARRADSL
jgi:hypothetical protein